MKLIFTLFLFLFQNENSEIEILQGKWLCITPKYKSHFFFVKNNTFFQKRNKVITEQSLGDEENPNEICGLFINCSDCWENCWAIDSLTQKDLILRNRETDEIIRYKKQIAKKLK